MALWETAFENEKRQNGGNQHFLLFLQCIQPNRRQQSPFEHLICCLKMLIIWLRTNVCRFVQSNNINTQIFTGIKRILTISLSHRFFIREDLRMVFKAVFVFLKKAYTMVTGSTIHVIIEFLGSIFPSPKIFFTLLKRKIYHLTM